jgi:hypothetical protein
MFGSKNRDTGSTTHDDDNGRTLDRTTDRDRPHGTSTDADVTSRMAGTGPRHAADRDADGIPDRQENGSTVTDTSRPAERYEERQRVLPAKTSAAAAFALAFGVAALVCALTGILSPVAVVLGLIGIVLGIVGMKKGRMPGVTGRGVALGGLITALLGFLLGAAVIAGAAVFVNDEANLDRLQGWIDDARADLPSGSDVVEEIPGS